MFSLFAFNFVNCKLTYNLLFYCYYLFVRFAFTFQWMQLSSRSFKMSVSLFLAFILSCSLLYNDSYWICLRDSLGDNCSASLYVWFLLSSLTVSVKLGTKCPVESNSAVVLATLLTIHLHKCYKGLELDPPGRKVILYQCIYFHWPHWFYAFFYSSELSVRIIWICVNCDENSDFYGVFWKCKPLYHLLV